MGQNVVIKSLEDGDGAIPELGQVIMYDFTGRILPDGEVFATRKDAKICLGDGDDTPGVELALRYMRIGQKALVRVQSRFAYGDVGRPACLPDEVAVLPGTDIEAELLLTHISTAEDPSKMTPAEKLADCRARKAQGNEHYKYHQYKKAIRCFKVRRLAAVMDCFQADDFEAGSEGFAAAVKLLVDCGNNVATCCAAMGDAAKARDAAHGVLALDADNVKALVRVGQTCVTLDDFDEAAAALARAQGLDPGHAGIETELRRLQVKRQECRKKSKEMQQRMSQTMFGSGKAAGAGGGDGGDGDGGGDSGGGGVP
ncbi:unnamed protein product, partial [Phaeothamnion confervicola]